MAKILQSSKSIHYLNIRNLNIMSRVFCFSNLSFKFIINNYKYISNINVPLKDLNNSLKI